MSYTEYGTPRDTNVRSRVLSRVHQENRGYETKCLIWEGEKDRDGYGKIKRNGRYVPVHWILAGDPPAGMEKDHLCHQRDCVRPTHLRDVTRLENNLARRGHTQNRLTPELKENIIKLLDAGVPVQHIVKSTRFSRTTIQKIKRER